MCIGSHDVDIDDDDDFDGIILGMQFKAFFSYI